MDMQDIIFKIAENAPGILLAIVFHEWAHGWAAKKFGDDTAERAGRLTFNPVPHIDPIGTIVFPLISVALGGVAFGWARPVPVNPSRFKNYRKGVFWVSFAGPLANFFLGVVCSLIFILSIKYFPEFALKGSFEGMLRTAIMINFVLMGFNLIPLPPLDGSQMVSSFLKGEMLHKYQSLERYTFFIFIGAILLGNMANIQTIGYFIQPFIYFANLILAVFNAVL